MNAGNADLAFVLPPALAAGWRLEIDSTQPALAAGRAAAQVTLPAHGLQVFTSAPGRA